MTISFLASLRIQCDSRAQADAAVTWLALHLGDACDVTAVHSGRDDGVWFVRGVLRVAHNPPLMDVIVRETGELLTIPARSAPSPPDDPQAATRLARLAGLRRPESRPDDGTDRRELHQRMREIKDKETPS